MRRNTSVNVLCTVDIHGIFIMTCRMYSVVSQNSGLENKAIPSIGKSVLEE